MSTRLGHAWSFVRQRPRRAVAALLALVVLVVGVFAAMHDSGPPKRLQEAEAALKRYDFTTAQQRLAGYLEDNPEDPAAHFLAARTARYTGDLNQAVEHLRRARRLGYPEAAVELEHLLVRASRRDPAALAQLEARAGADGPDTPAVLEVLVQHYIEAYRLREAVSALDRLLAIQPDNVKALLGRGRVKERLFDYAASIQDYRAALVHAPEADDVRARLGGVLLINGRPEEASAEFAQLRRRQGDTPDVLLGLARCSRHEGKLPEALALLDRLLQGTPDSAVALGERGRVLLEMGQPDQAEASLRRAVQLAPYDREALHSLYQCLRGKGQSQEASAVLTRYQELDANLRRLDKVTSAVIANPADLGLRCEAAELFRRLGEPREAERWLRTVLLMDPNHPGALAALARYFPAADLRSASEPERQPAP